MTSFVEKIVVIDEHLDRADVIHAFGGAIALGYHVEHPRATADIDVNITADTGTAGAVLTALPAGVSWSRADVEQVQSSGQTRVFWGHTPLDLFFPQHDLHAVVAGRVERVPLAGRMIPIVSATDLTIFKALFDRSQDWVDIENMLGHGRVDVAEARSWLVALLGRSDHRVARLERLT